MSGSPEQALYVLDRAAEVRARADATWRSAIRQALASEATVEQVATRAHTNVDIVLAIVRATPRASRRDGGCFRRNAGAW
ncbi:hypothetical protein WEI85_12725 [Actinomycetes bacterium KLBMP 9797]